MTPEDPLIVGGFPKFLVNIPVFYKLEGRHEDKVSPI